MSWIVDKIKWILLASGALPGRDRFGPRQAVFIALVLAQGERHLGQQAMVAVVVDSAIVLLFAGYLVGVRRARRA